MSNNSFPNMNSSNKLPDLPKDVPESGSLLSLPEDGGELGNQSYGGSGSSSKENKLLILVFVLFLVAVIVTGVLLFLYIRERDNNVDSPTSYPFNLSPESYPSYPVSMVTETVSYPMSY